jgi:AcrR family transcriptional regulator
MSDATRERILYAAGPIFAEKGFAAATVREICAAADANLASVNYHFRDKDTLYLETVRLAHTLRVEQVPLPPWPRGASPKEKLAGFIRTVLSRMLGTDELGWQTRLLMREMIHPTIACQPLVEDFIRPQLSQLLAILDELLPSATAQHRRLQIAFSIIGQCLHYRVASEFVALLIPKKERAAHYGIEPLAEHITEFSLRALSEWSRGSGSDARRNRSRRASKRADAKPISH